MVLEVLASATPSILISVPLVPTGFVLFLLIFFYLFARIKFNCRYLFHLWMLCENYTSLFSWMNLIVEMGL